ncbi:YifB family Mg chelatase-like AAA ATPase [Microbacterium radiodurans]|uniref:YifB family Mg chelatase-like AAA ATPase n=1 Tax=Microbacterium radiodurans TaxID=661398 RepID=A0A5J5ISM9_9MICO|nr:YifB family Mg chelatase-like AAA ATPase [Microbacterium radiodurans]KAA9086888.1 YifB family Mg chelatase-like AAA ATPase [Microbacterium radiodurans]
MSVGRTWAIALSGLVGDLVEVEADLSNQTPAFRIVGLADRALTEAQQRVHNACANSGLPLSRRRVTVNLSPASLPKHGSGFDLAIAIAALATELPMDAASLAETVHIGELALDGRLRPVPGVLPAVLAAARGGRRQVVVPEASRAEAELVDGIRVVACRSLAAVARWHGLDVAEPVPTEHAVTDDGKSGGAAAAEATQAPRPDLAEVRGQAEAVDALIVAAAGGHHLLMSGPPGAGKTMLARRLSGILPDLDDDTALQVASIRSLSGTAVTTLTREPPFEAPHHSASVAALVGGGSRELRPGAIARASGGVLFLDEAGEYGAHALDSLRQPLEEGSIEIHRAGFRAVLPARFQLVLATNPCPCGQYGVRGGTCSCPSLAIRRYVGRLSGPLLDRIDIELGLSRVSLADLSSSADTTISTRVARERVVGARERAARRLAATPWRTNAAVPGSWLRDGPLAPAADVRRPLDSALQRGALTLRGYDRVLRVAWSVADLRGGETLQLDDIGHALYLKKGIGA